MFQRRTPGKRRQRLVVFALAVLASAGASAHAGLSAIAEEADSERAIPRGDSLGDLGYEHFPGSAYYFVQEDNAVSTPGATGYFPLPKELLGLGDLVPMPGGPGAAAAPALFRSATATDSLRASVCLATAIYYEAASESDDGQRAVAQVVLNRVRHPAFPNSVCGVVYQGSERATGCQFSFTCDGALSRAPSRAGWARASRIAHEALAGAVYAPVGLATHYHTLAVSPFWAPSLTKAAIVGAHIFYRWPGGAGTPGAFRQAYALREPVPGPYPRVVSPAEQLAALAVPTTPLPAMQQALASVQRVQPVNIQPAYETSGQPLAGGRAAITPESQIREEWRDSGRWIAR